MYSPEPRFTLLVGLEGASDEAKGLPSKFRHTEAFALTSLKQQ
jgi:hypothetical protein